MRLKNSPSRYGWISIGIHWLTAFAVFGLFFVGNYMVDLTYYDPNYRTVPALHKAVGLTLFALLLFRIGWHLKVGLPSPIASLRWWEIKAAQVAHKLLYVLLLVTTVSGYLISTAKGQGIEVFGLFTAPALPWAIPQQEDIAGQIHDLAAHALFFLALFHGAAGLKHHFWDKDATLKRMLGVVR